MSSSLKLNQISKQLTSSASNVPAILTAKMLSPSSVQSKFSGGTAHILPQERKKATFSVEKLTHILDGGKEQTALKNFIRSPMKSANNNQNFGYKFNMRKEELLGEHIKHFYSIHKKFADSNYWPKKRMEICWMAEVSQLPGAMGLHSIYMGVLFNMADEEQQSWWAVPAKKFQIVGSYVQTELGHGSNVRGLQTTATFDRESQEFILETPTLRSIKWWPGGLGKIATHAVVFAQLIIDGKEHGVHFFHLQLRDENHKPLPGIQIGDIGTKVADHSTDAGYLVLNKVRIPRRHMLSKYQEVTSEGKFIEKGKVDKKISYATMVFTRVHLIHLSYSQLAKACTIAARYSCCREQGFKDLQNESFKSEENSIIEYKIQQYRIFKQIAIAFALKITAMSIIKFGEEIESGHISEVKNMSALKELAATSSGVKSLATILCADGTEDLRKSCGGNGFLLHSGIAEIALQSLLPVTAEGDYVLLYLFTSQFLLKAVRHMLNTQKKESGYMDYLNTMITEPHFQNKIKGFIPPAASHTSYLNRKYILELFQFRILKTVVKTAQKMQNKVFNEGLSMLEAVNACALDLKKAAELHSQYILYKNFIEKVDALQNIEPQIYAVLDQLCCLFGCTNIKDTPDWGAVLECSQYDLVDQAIDILLEKLRPNCIALVDSFDMPDYALNSSIGNYDGNIYEGLFSAAENSLLNVTEPFIGYEQYLKPNLDLELLKKGKLKSRI